MTVIEVDLIITLEVVEGKVRARAVVHSKDGSPLMGFGEIVIPSGAYLCVGSLYAVLGAHPEMRGINYRLTFDPDGLEIVEGKEGGVK